MWLFAGPAFNQGRGGRSKRTLRIEEKKRRKVLAYPSSAPPRMKSHRGKHQEGQRCSMKIKVIFGGIGTILTIVFVVLKLTGVVSWSWLTCFLPLLIGAALTIILFGIMFVLMSCTGPSDFSKIDEGITSMRELREYRKRNKHN